MSPLKTQPRSATTKLPLEMDSDGHPKSLSDCEATTVSAVRNQGEENGEDNWWPGRDFELREYLPGSVYLWACGERDDGEDQAPSASDAVVAWAVLLVQIAGYGVLLWAVNVSDTSRGEYSVLSIAVAMYLNISIASSDLWASFALIMSNRGCRAFGIALLASFIMLFASSTRVLFSTSGNNVDLIIDAAAVLFIADMDEKLMVVLKKTKSDWRLFWVVQLVGMSVTLALAGIKYAGNPVATTEKSTETPESVGPSASALEEKAVFGWKFLLFHSPVAVTSLSMVVRAIAMHLVDLFENGNGRNDFKSFIFAVKPRCTAYRGLIAALVLLEIGPFMAAVFISPHAGHRDSCALQVVRHVKAAGAVMVGCFCAFYDGLPAASSLSIVERFCRGLYKVAFLGLLVLHPMSFVEFPWFRRWRNLTMAVLVRCLSVVVYGFWCSSNWNVFQGCRRFAPKQQPRWKIMFVLVWLLLESYFISRLKLLGDRNEGRIFRLISESMYLIVGINVAFECVGHPCCTESPRPSSKTFSLLLAWCIYRLTAWDILLALDDTYFRESFLDLDFGQHWRSFTLHVVFLYLGTNAQARTLRNESVQFCLIVILLSHVVVIWFYTLVSAFRTGTIK